MRRWRYTRPVLVVLLACGLLTYTASAQSFGWRSFFTDDGLPAATVEAVAQVSDGTLWVGTARGLYRFFGGRFRPEPESGFAMSTIHALAETHDGSLYAATDTGLYRSDETQHWQGPLDLGVDAYNVAALLVTTSSGTLWAGMTDGDCGLVRGDAAGWQVILVRGLSPCVNALAEDGAGRIWVATPDQLFILDGERLLETVDAEAGLPLGAELTALERDADGEIWLATRAGIVQFTGASIRQTYTGDDGLGSTEVETLLADPEGGLWAGTEAGLSRINDGAVQRTWTQQDGLIDDTVHALTIDDDNNLWVGTAGGMTRMALDRWVYEAWPALKGAAVNALLVGTVQGDYAGVAAGIAHHQPDGSWAMVEIGPSAAPIYTLIGDANGDVWAGTASGLYRLQGNSIVREEQISGTVAVDSLLLDDRETLWVGTAEGLYTIQGTGPAIRTGSEPGQKPILALWQNSRSEVWAGVAGLGAVRLQPELGPELSLTSTNGGLVTNYVTAGLEDGVGNLWLGTTQGVSVLQADQDPAVRESWRTYIAGEQINALWEDRWAPGMIWAGTEDGVALLAHGAVSRFGAGDGLPDKRISSLGQDAEGNLWIGTPSGLTYHRDAGRRPQIRLEEPLIDGQQCDLTCRSAGIDYRSRNVEYRFEGSDLADLEGLQYEYRLTLVGASGDREERYAVTPAHSVSETLRSGSTYTFTARALDRHFNPSDFVEAQVFTVLQPRPWQPGHPLFFPLIGFGGVMLVTSGGYLWSVVRPRLRYPYLDLCISIQPAATAGHYRVQMVMSRGPTWMIRLQQWAARKLAGRQGAVLPSLVYDRIFPGTMVEEQIARLEAGELDEDLEEDPEEALRELGDALYTALFSLQASEQLKRYLPLGTRVRRLLRQGLRIRLDFSRTPELDTFPWELLYEQDIGFLGRRQDIALVRYRQPQGEHVQRPAAAQLRILVVMALPNEEWVPRLDLAGEKQSLDRLQRNSSFTIRYLLGLHAAEAMGIHEDSENLQIAGDMHLRTLLEHEIQAGWDVVHFVGHAGPDPTARRPDGEIVLWSEDQRGEFHALGPAMLQRWLAELAPAAKTPLVVVLAACRTADIQSQLVQTFLDSGVAAVVGMQWPVKDAAAKAFANGFYETLVEHGQVDHAVAVGRSRMLGELWEGQRDWAAPVLITQRDNGQIFAAKERKNHAATRN